MFIKSIVKFQWFCILLRLLRFINLVLFYINIFVVLATFQCKGTLDIFGRSFESIGWGDLPKLKSFDFSLKIFDSFLQMKASCAVCRAAATLSGIIEHGDMIIFQNPF